MVCMLFMYLWLPCIIRPIDRPFPPLPTHPHDAAAGASTQACTCRTWLCSSKASFFVLGKSSATLVIFSLLV